MCVVSMVGDHYRDKWNPMEYPWIYPSYPAPTTTPNRLSPTIQGASKEEVEQLRKEVAELKALLKRAKEYDEKNNEPDCEIEDKMKFLKEVAKLVGIDLDEVLKGNK